VAAFRDPPASILVPERLFRQQLAPELRLRSALQRRSVGAPRLVQHALPPSCASVQLVDEIVLVLNSDPSASVKLVVVDSVAFPRRNRRFDARRPILRRSKSAFSDLARSWLKLALCLEYSRTFLEQFRAADALATEEPSRADAP